MAPGRTPRRAAGVTTSQQRGNRIRSARANPNPNPRTRTSDADRPRRPSGARVTSSQGRGARSRGIGKVPKTYGTQADRQLRSQSSTARVTESRSNGLLAAPRERPTVTSSAQRPATSTGARVTSSQGRGARSQAGRGNPTTYGNPVDRSQRAQTSTAQVTQGRGGISRAAQGLAIGGLTAAATRVIPGLNVVTETLRARPVADATLRNKPTSAGRQGPAVPQRLVREGQRQQAARQASARSFDSAFAAARSAGYKTFTWRGKRYTTDMK